MSTGYTPADGYTIIRMALNSIADRVQEKLRLNHANIPSPKYDAAMRALRYMKQVARRPELYFSRAQTEGSWRASIQQYAINHNMRPEHWEEAVAMVQSPEQIVISKAAPAFYNMPDLKQQYEKLCNLIFDWEYDRTAPRGVVTNRANDALLHIMLINNVLSERHHDDGGLNVKAVIKHMYDAIRAWQR